MLIWMEGDSMITVRASNIRSPEKKNDLILYANDRQCGVFYNEKYGLVIECHSCKVASDIRKKVKELSD